MNERHGPTLGFETREEFLAWMLEKEGEQFFAGRTGQDVCDWFLCSFYGPQVLSPVFRRSIRELLAGRRPAPRPGRLCPQKNRTVFVLPPSPHWLMGVDVPAEACSLPFLYVTNATADQWRTHTWRLWRSYLFFADWAELRAAYRVARLILVGQDAADAAAKLRYIFAGEMHALQLGCLRPAELRTEGR